MSIIELNVSIVLPYGFFEPALLNLQFLTVFLTCPKEPMRMLRGLEHLSNRDRLREMEVFNLEMRRLQGHHIVDSRYLKGAYKKMDRNLLQEQMSYL